MVRQYLNEVGRYPMLTAEEEVELGAKVQAGEVARARLESGESLSPSLRNRLARKMREGDAAVDAFITANLRLVVSIAKHYRWSRLPLLDLIQEGNLGLIRAVHGYDAERGFRFSTYATWWIRQSIARGVRNSERSIRIPAHIADHLTALNRVSTAMYGELAHEPTDEELAQELGWTTAEIRGLRELPEEPRSLDAPLGDDGDGDLDAVVADGDAVDPLEDVMAGSLSTELEQLLAHELNARECMVLQLRFGLDGSEPRTLEAVGDVLGTTRERVRQLEARALQKLQNSQAGQDLAELFPV